VIATSATFTSAQTEASGWDSRGRWLERKRLFEGPIDTEFEEFMDRFSTVLKHSRIISKAHSAARRRLDAVAGLACDAAYRLHRTRQQVIIIGNALKALRDTL
jgi:hypothetical protein